MEKIEFPCPNSDTGELTSIGECTECEKSKYCDTYSFMLDETFDSQQ